ncbi:MAG: hypothetical protein JJT76_18705, partial [Clostridiaceae bacterium]|nr:hypothetical protein [Clostridiaceae bacterium]
LWDLDRKLKEGTDAVYFINYFGFPQPKALQQYLLENKDSVTIIEDCTYSLFSKGLYPEDYISDYQIASLRK